MGFVSGAWSDAWRVPTLEDLPDPAGRSVLVRATFDRPMVADPTRPLARRRAVGLAATVDWLLARGARVTLCGDAGREEGSAGSRLDEVRAAVRAVSTGPAAGGGFEVVVAREAPSDVGRLIDRHDLFVNDSLQDSVLPFPSLTLPPRRLPAAVGRTLQADLAALDGLLFEPPRPFVAVLGGRRSFERLHGLRGLVLRADLVLLGGALAVEFLAAVGRLPPFEAPDDLLAECRDVIGLSRRVRHEILLPIDLVWRGPHGLDVTPAHVRGGREVVDLGPQTRVRFADMVTSAGSVLWTGALGRVEDPACAEGSRAVAASLPAPPSALAIGGEALVDLLGTGALPPSAALLSATDAAIELLKSGDLPVLAALRRPQEARA